MKIVINNKHLEIKEKKMLSTGNVNTYIIDVEYDNTYKGRQLIIYFKNNDVKKIAPVGPDDKVIVPHEVLKEVGTLFVGFYSHKSKDEVLIDRYSSNLDTLPVIEGAYDEDAEYSEELSPNIVEQYLQEMKEFYDKSFKEYNNNASIKLKEYNDNASQKLTEYNNNSEDKLEEYNLNADNKKEEIDKVAGEVTQNKTDIEEIEKRVSASEQNAKASETNAKTSEQSAQNSLNKVTEIETNITGIQEEINQTKEEIDTTKTSIDNSVEEVNRAVTEATNQASESKKQADIAITNANQTSTDKQAAETMKNDISVMKTSVEQTKSATEQIKADTQSIYNNTVDAKNETLEAKETVESSLENERIESDKKYAQAIESDEIVVDEEGQVELDEDGFMKDVSIESNLPDITQEAREGYNLINLNKQFPYTSHGVTVDKKSDGRIVLNGTADANFNISFSEYFEISNLVSKNLTLSVKTIGIGKINNIGLKRYYAENVLVLNNIENDTTKNTSVENFNPEYTNATGVAAWVLAETVFENFTIYLTLVEGSEEKPYEQYGASPSLENPSPFKNVVKDIEVLNCHENLLNVVDNIKRKQFHNGLDYEIQDDGSIIINGTVSGYSGIYSYGGFGSTNKVLKFHKGHKYRIYMEAKNTSNQVARAYFGKPNKNDFEVNCFNDGISYKDYTVQEDYMITHFSINGGTTGNVRENLIVKVWIIDITNGVPENEEYKQYNGYNENLALKEGQFLGNFNGFKNYTKNNKLKGRLKILTLTGQEVWMATESNTFYYTGIADYKRGTELICLCNYFKSQPNVGNSSNVEDGCCSFYSGTGVNRIYLNDSMFEKNVSKLKTWLKEKYDAGTPVQIVYVTNEEYEEDLSVENKSKINSLKVYKDINNIYSNCKISFRANKNLEKKLDEYVKKTDYSTNTQAGLVTSGYNSFQVEGLTGRAYASVWTYEKYKGINNNHFISKGTLDNVLDYERENNNKRYAEVLKGIVEEKKEVQIYAGNKNVDNLILKSNQITQETRNGYNKYNKNTSVVGKIDATGVVNSAIYDWETSDFIEIEELLEYLLSWKSTSSFFQVTLAYFNSDKELIDRIDIQQHNLYKYTFSTPENTSYLRFSYSKAVNSVSANRTDIQLVEGTEEKSYEEYGASPSLNHPSEIKVTTEQNINVSKGNLLNVTIEDVIKSGVKVANNGDGSVNIKGTSTETSKNISFDLGTIELKKGESISVKPYGLEGLSTDIRFLTLVNAGVSTLIDFRNKDFATYTPTEDVTGTFRFYVKPGQAVDVTIKVMAVKGIKTVEEMPEFRKYQSKDYNIILPEGNFNNSLGNRSNYISKINNKWCLVNYIKNLVLDGSENWKSETTSIGKRFVLDLNEAEVANSNKNPIALCTHFRLGKDSSTWGELNLFVIYQLENFRRLAFGSFDDISEISEWKVILQEHKDKGTPIIVCYTLVEPEIIELPEEIQNTLNSIELMDDLNIVTIDNGTFSFEYNKSLVRVLEEKDQEIDSLKEQLNQKAGNSAFGTVKGANACNFSNGSPYATTLTLEQYKNVGNTNFIGKGTLENILAPIIARILALEGGTNQASEDNTNNEEEIISDINTSESEVLENE